MFSNHVELNVNISCRRVCSLNWNASEISERRDNSSSEEEEEDDVILRNTGDAKKLKFLVGSCHSENNELLRLEFDQDAHEVYESAVYGHPSGPVWSLSPSHHNAGLIATCGGSTPSNMQTTIWKLPIVDESPQYDENDEGIQRADLLMQTVVMVDDGHSDAQQAQKSEIIWSPHNSKEFMTVNSRSIQSWHFKGDGADEKAHFSLMSAPNNLSPLGRVPAVYDVHDSNRICVAVGCDLKFWDTRSRIKEATATLAQAHKNCILDVDVNPHRPHTFVTSGQEGLLKFWDVRMLSKSANSRMQPIKVVKGGHTHWISRVVYNTQHDQLLLSAGTDSFLNLWRLSSISSAPILEVDDEETAKPDQSNKPASSDIRVLQFECQESLYDVTWLDAWTFASVTHDGQVIVNQVPSQEKYKILL